MNDSVENLVEYLRTLDIDGIDVHYGAEAVDAGGTGPLNPSFEPGPYRETRPSGQVTITIRATDRDFTTG